MRGRPIPYSAEELAFIEARQAMPRCAIRAEFCAAFAREDVQVDDIKALCTRRGWSTGRTPWLPEDDALLRELYPDKPAEQVARRLGRALQATYRRAQLLGLAKSAAFLRSEASGRIKKGATTGAAHRFATGHVSATKGIRRPGWAAGRSGETQFKPGTRGGRAQHLWKPVGSERMAGDYRWTKVTDIQGAPWTVNWRQTHILRWEAINGPVPKGHALKCLDSDRLNTDPANWQLVSRGVLARLNGGRMPRRVRFDEAPAELKPTLMAVAKLEHAVHTRKRSAQRASV